MPRKERGLPADYGLSVPDAPIKRTPVRLDDYLDREIGGDQTQAAVAPRPAATPVDAVTQFRMEEEGQVAVSSPAAVRQFQSTILPLRPGPTFPQRFKQRPAPIKAPRVQLNMTPEIQRMVQELVGHFCAFGLQKDTSASEVFEALVSALHESRDQLDLSNVPPRGQWGTPTARAFRTNLKNVVMDAIARHSQRLAS
jgi:hypothetical protein